MPISADQPLVYRSRWVCPVAGEPIENGAVRVQTGRVVAMDRVANLDSTGATTVDLGEGALIPGLVNAHTHLEFSDCERPIGSPGITLTAWIREIVKTRIATLKRGNRGAVIRSGLTEAFASGSWQVGEIATAPWTIDSYLPAEDSNETRQHSSRPLQRVPMALTLFLEQLGSDPAILETRAEELDTFLKFTSGMPTSMARGVSPHAPYSVSPALLQQMLASARQYDVPVAMHVAESEAERQLLEQGRGPMVDLLQDFGVWRPENFGQPDRTLEILHQLARCRRSLVVHGNYLSDPELDWIAEQGHRMSIVYCPRTHHFFRHRDYPLAAILRRGINLAVGTDSRGSNPDLNLFAELQFLASRFPELSAATVLRVGTVDGAQALGDTGAGVIAVGAAARLSLVRNANGHGHVDQWLFDSSSVCTPVV